VAKEPQFDRGSSFCYTNDMLSKTEQQVQKTTRKKRSDRTHIVYMLVVNGLRYIGVTAKTESTVLKSVRARAAKHFYRAKTETKDWALCGALRTLNSKEEIEIRVVELLRGKAVAHKREVEIRRELRPELNTDVRGD
jgi:hypothetical protein